LGKSANRRFESASQDFFYVEGKFPRRALAAALAARTNVVEPERMLSFFNAALAFGDKAARALPGRTTRAA
jgi:hypothetical protein